MDWGSVYQFSLIMRTVPLSKEGIDMALIKEYLINIAPISWKRAGLRDRTFFDQQTQEKLMFGIYLNSQHGDSPKFISPVHMDVTFHMPIPKTVAKRKNTIWHSSMPDIDNLQKFLLDAINDTGIIWKDDSIVSSVIARKVYDKKPRTHIIITELE